MDLDDFINCQFAPKVAHKQKSEESKAEADDDIVREIGVFFNPSIDQDTQVRVKPKTNEVEIDLGLDVNSKNYDHHSIISGSGEQVTKQETLTWQTPPAIGYAVGVLKGNQLHLKPAVVQLRRSMQHLDTKESRRKTNAATDPAQRASSSRASTSRRITALPLVQINDSGKDLIPVHVVAKLRPSMHKLDPKESRRKTNAATDPAQGASSSRASTSRNTAPPVVQTNDSGETLTWQTPPAIGYAVGVLKGNQLHLNPDHMQWCNSDRQCSTLIPKNPGGKPNAATDPAQGASSSRASVGTKNT